MSYDAWKTTEPDIDRAPGEHRHGDEECDCYECEQDRQDAYDRERRFLCSMCKQPQDPTPLGYAPMHATVDGDEPCLGSGEAVLRGDA